MDTRGPSKNGDGARPDAVLNPGRTAITRNKASVPARALVEGGWLDPGDAVYDWGCGKGKDLEYLRENGFVCGGYDVAHRPFPQPGQSKIKYNWILCAYVLNVIPPIERSATVRAIYKMLPDNGQAMFAVRSMSDISNEVKDTWIVSYDGWRTPIGTFQKGFTVDELHDLVCDRGFRMTELVSSSPVILVASKFYGGTQ